VEIWSIGWSLYVETRQEDSGRAYQGINFCVGVLSWQMWRELFGAALILESFGSTCVTRVMVMVSVVDIINYFCILFCMIFLCFYLPDEYVFYFRFSQISLIPIVVVGMWALLFVLRDMYLLLWFSRLEVIICLALPVFM
jgi:hypothetical protein